VTARRYLESVGEMEARLNMLLRQQAVLKGIAQAQGQDQPRREAQARAVAEAIQAAWQALHRQRRLVGHTISRLPREEERSLLSLRYLSCLGYPDIAEILGYSQRQVFRIHQRALMHLEALMDGYGADVSA
jgi:DNA-directed RNA polymerase specialized sigma subunit